MDRTCPVCGLTKTLETDFPSAGPGYYRKLCRKCYSKQQSPKMMERYRADPDSYNARRKAANAKRKKVGTTRRPRLTAEDYRAKMKASAKRRRLGYKIACFEGYGGCRCACCGETEVEFLSLDHINGGGTAMRRAGERGGDHLYLKLITAGFPPGYRVLCFNCNWAVRHGGVCPHQRAKALSAV